MIFLWGWMMYSLKVEYKLMDKILFPLCGKHIVLCSRTAGGELTECNNTKYPTERLVMLVNSHSITLALQNIIELEVWPETKANKMKESVNIVVNQNTLRIHAGDSIVIRNVVVVVKDLVVHGLKLTFQKHFKPDNQENNIPLVDCNSPKVRAQAGGYQCSSFRPLTRNYTTNSLASYGKNGVSFHHKYYFHSFSWTCRGPIHWCIFPQAWRCKPRCVPPWILQ